eukprot:5348578-Pleurochrysis_carterae.AAC.1
MQWITLMTDCVLSNYALHSDFALQAYICADNKGVEALRGCTACCPWCRCDDTLRLTCPWPVDQPPLTWPHAAAMLSQQCRHPFPSVPLIHEAAHEPLPGELLPQKCHFCRALPFKDVAELEAERACWRELAADRSREGLREFAKERSNHCKSHMSQHKFQVPNFLVGMEMVVPEIMHVGDPSRWTSRP